MPIDPQQTPDFPFYDAPASGPETALQPPEQVKPAPVAPLWHTLLIAALVLGNSFLGSSKLDSVGGSGHGSRLLLYGGTFLTQVVLVLIIWFGIRLRGVRMRDLIGGRWQTVETFLLDVALAIGFWIVSLALLFVLRVALGTIDIHHLAKSQEDTLKLLGPLAPHSYLEAGFWVVLSISAGLFEEIIFRGYFQRQFLGLTRNAAFGIIASGIVFGLAHGYQGARLMVAIAVFGMLFGVMAHLRKSLRPGMMAHAFQDSIAGLAIFALVRHH
jgi:membrane protease YdiL (CAAX protease family)